MIANIARFEHKKTVILIFHGDAEETLPIGWHDYPYKIEYTIDEIKGFLKSGHYFPAFPLRANPTVQYAWDLSADGDVDGDCYGEIINELDKIILQ